MKPDSTRRFFDVAPPGQATPSATSRPVIPQRQPLTQDPMFSDQPAFKQPAPAPAPATPPVENNLVPQPPVQPEPVPVEELDPTALLIQAGNWQPPKASPDRVRRMALIAMTVILVLICAVTYWLVSTM